MNIGTIRDLLLSSASKYGENTAFLLRDAADVLYGKSYGEFLSDVKALACYLDGNVSFGGKIAIYMKNCYEWCLCYFACAFTGRVAVPLDKQLPFEELCNIVDFADVDTVFTDGTTVKTLAENRGNLTRNVKIICSEEYSGDGIYDIKSLLKKNAHENKIAEILKREIAPDSLAVLLFTSGTTGMTKGVMLSHSNIISDIQNVKKCVDIKETDRTLSVLPLHHTYEAIAFLMMIYSGACISFSRGLRYLQKDFSEVKPTILVTVPLMLEKLHGKIMSKIQSDGNRTKAKIAAKLSPILPKESRNKIFSEIHSFFGSELRLIIAGAASLQKQVAEDFTAFGIPVIIGYGLTECSPIVICNTDKAPLPDSIGKPLPDVQVKIENPDENGIGEICVKGPMVMLGYYKDDTKTKESMRGGFFHTGDLGYVDKHGNYHITGRTKNVIITRNGKNVYPEEIEHYLLRHGVVAECVVRCIDGDIIEAEIYPDEKAVLQKLRKNAVTKDEVGDVIKQTVRLVNSKLPSYKRVKKVILRQQEFEKTTTHKIKR